VRISVAALLGISFGAYGWMNAEVGGTPGRSVPPLALNQLPSVGGWPGLLKPVAIQVAEDGLVYVADRGDGKVRVFSAEGAPVREFGSVGDGPGEFRNIRNLVVTGATVSIFDSKPTRVLRLSLSGAFQSSVTVNAFGDEMISGLGEDRLLFASSGRWASPPVAGEAPRPLVRIVDTAGTAVGGIGRRVRVASPFASHIINFVVPAGTRDGKFVWLARLNSPEVLLYRTATEAIETIPRTLPFRHRQIAEDFTPASMKPAPGKPFVAPFDAITYGVAADREGRAYILTALESSQAAAGEPGKMAVDVITPGNPSKVRRFSVSGFYSTLAVTLDGRRIYLLNPATGEIRLFSVPR